MNNTKMILMLENEKIIKCDGFGYIQESVGEIVFNTGMAGYQDTFTDPSYFGQIIIMTYPLIGNCGINLDDNESNGPKIRGLVINELCEYPSNFRNVMLLSEYLYNNKIVGVQNIDTRELVKIIRDSGTMKAIITPESSFNLEDAKKKIEKFYEKNIISNVSTKKIIHHEGNGKRIVIIDCGVKENIIRSLLQRNCEIYQVPYNINYEEIFNLNPDGIILSNGPGDPKDCIEVIETTKKLFSKIPIFGICLGHQILALANGADTEKLKYGHRGINHPVKDLDNNLIYITSQNHGYTIVKNSIKDGIMKVSHINVNDDSIEGVVYKDTFTSSVQFHPEASPGPKDTAYLFDKFIDKI